MAGIPYYTNKTIEHKAGQLRLKYLSNSIPVDVELLAEKMGLDLIPSGQLRMFNCEALLTNSLQEIVYADNALESRLRFSIAHELGHLTLHSEQIKLFRPSSIEEWKKFSLEIDPSIIGRAEYQSNLFSSYLLIPVAFLGSEIQKFSSELKRVPKDQDVNPTILNEFLAPGLAKAFNVSQSAMKNYLNNNNVNPMDYIN